MWLVPKKIKKCKWVLLLCPLCLCLWDIYIYISEPIYPARTYSCIYLFSMSFCRCICRLDGGGGWLVVEQRSVIWLGSGFRQRFCICLITTHVHFNPKTSSSRRPVWERERRHFRTAKDMDCTCVDSRLRTFYYVHICLKLLTI